MDAEDRMDPRRRAYQIKAVLAVPCPVCFSPQCVECQTPMGVPCAIHGARWNELRKKKSRRLNGDTNGPKKEN